MFSASFLIKILGGHIFGFLRDYWKQMIVLAAVGVIALYWIGRTNTIKEQQQTIISLNSDIAKITTQMETDQKNFREVIGKQNKQIEQMVIYSNRLKESVRIAQQKANRFSKQGSNRADTTMAGPTPKSCQEAIDYLVDSVSELKWENSK